MRLFLILLGIVVSGLVYGQEPKTTDFLTEITKHDISHLWTLKQFQAGNDTVIVERQEPVGFIGENYQRFYIHFISAIQNPTDKLKYLIYGKTKVKENICSFQGQITINEARIYVEGDLPPLKQGFVKGIYEFYEDSKQQGTGELTGTFTTNFYIDKKGNIQYDAICFVADGFNNNQFTGHWISYKTGESKRCNWGDYRIPECDWQNGRDIGAGEFSINDKYLKNGWENYKLAWETYPETPEVIKAREKENEKWWINK
ncbi:hypothetical protein [Microbacter margulisiae]|uniref:Uncharacterized protein n=1 Tax=Microbacter margulisiae TaxID=1350067 RepID=A0A7W5DP01_9PORP|nr:hypothetical protein [Microbacter margulisiae]MBB3186337.1 hypothetical protein [Microbacter margulisiae]